MTEKRSMTEKVSMEEIEVTDFPKTDYEPLVDYEGWRVAVLAYCENTRIERIKTMQKHLYTDEVFVLIRGNATLYTAGNTAEIGELKAVKLQPHKVYNVKKGVWHNHVLDEEGIVLIVENQDTCDENSPIMNLSEEQIRELYGL